MPIEDYEQPYDYKLIYVMEVPDERHAGLLKVGEAKLDSTKGPTQLPPNCDDLNAAAHKRIKEYTTTALIDYYELLYTELATIELVMQDGTHMSKSFGDDEVHKVLDRSMIRCQKFHDSGVDSEWYESNLQTTINAIKAYKENRLELTPSEKIGATETDEPVNVQEITLRQEQQEAVDKALAVFKHSDRMLWDCKMRFGKTVSAYELIKEGAFQKTLIVTHRPIVEEGWHKDHDLIFGPESQHLFVTKKVNDSKYEYDAEIDSQNDRNLRSYDSRGLYFSYFASMQDLRGSQCVGGKFDKNHAVFDLDWDLIIYDEAHEGTQTDLGQAVMDLLEAPKNGKAPKVLSLSGTPYNLLNQYEDDNVYVWDYVMEQRRKKEYAEQHPDSHNPYADLPELRILTFDMQRVLAKSYRYVTEDLAFNFHEFFRTWTGHIEHDLQPVPQDAAIGDFVHEEDIAKFLDLITTESDDSNYPFSTEYYRSMFRHTFWMVPGVKEAKALSRLLNKHPIFKNYKIANVAGDGDQEKDYADALSEVQGAISNNKYTITISCGRLTTGVTVPEWSAVMMLAGSANTSASGYMQTIFRVQSVGSVDGKQKEIAYVFDFAPDRALNALTQAQATSTRGKKSAQDIRVALGEFLNFCPVIAVQGTQMVEYDVPRMMRQLKRMNVDKAIKSGFEDESIYNDGVGIVMDEEDKKLFNALAARISGQGKSRQAKKITITENGFTDEEYRKAENAKRKRPRERTPEEKELIRKEHELREARDKVIRLLRAISIRLPLLIYGAGVNLTEDIHMSDFIHMVDDESWQEFMPQGVDKEMFQKLLRYYDEDVVIAAGSRIRNLAKAADELPPTKRVERITEIFSYFRNPDKETVLTPWRVVNMQMGDTIGGFNFFEDGYPPAEDNNLEKPRLIENYEITADLFLNPDVQMLEMNSKSGLYPLYLAYSMYAMQLPKPEVQMSLTEMQGLWQTILDRNIYVLCRTKMAASITRRTLAGYQDNWSVNVIYLTHLIERMQSDKQRLARKLTNPETWNKGGDRMQFNAIVGNPPYQLTGGSGGTNDAPVYQEFATLAETLQPRFISLVIPSRWFTGGRENLLGNFRKSMLQNKEVRELYAFIDSSDLFPTVEIKGGVCYYLIDSDYSGDCLYTLVEDKKRRTYTRDLGDFDVLIREPLLSEIVKKVMSDSPQTVDRIISGDTPFGIPTNPRANTKNSFELFDKPDKSHNVALLYLEDAKRCWAYIAKEQIKKNVGDIAKNKVFIPEAGGSGNDPYVLGKPELGSTNSICSQTFLYAPFESRQEAENFISYVRTKFFRVLVSASKVSQHATSKTYRFVPMQDFTKPWTDEELYKKYKLADEEIKFIETNIKPME